MIRKTELLECDDEEDLTDAARYCAARTDGGRTVIKLTGCKPYHLAEPLYFPSSARVTVDFNGLEVRGSD